MSKHRQWGMSAVAAGLMLILLSPAQAGLISLEWRPLAQTVWVGDPVGVGLYAVSATGQNENFNSAQVIVTWDPAYLGLTGVDQTGAVLQPPDDQSAFLAGDGYGLNETNPPADGDGMWYGLVTLGQVRYATPAGALLTTLTFDALAETACTQVQMLGTIQKPGHPVAYSRVMQGTYDVLDAVGAPACITILPEPTGIVLLLAVAVLSRRR